MSVLCIGCFYELCVCVCVFLFMCVCAFLCVCMCVCVCAFVVALDFYLGFLFGRVSYHVVFICVCVSLCGFTCDVVFVVFLELVLLVFILWVVRYRRLLSVVLAHLCLCRVSDSRSMRFRCFALLLFSAHVFVCFCVYCMLCCCRSFLFFCVSLLYLCCLCICPLSCVRVCCLFKYCVRVS